MDDKKTASRGRALSNFFIILLGTIILLYAISVILPLVWGLITSLKSNMDFQYQNNKLWFPNAEFSAAEIKLANYSLILNNFTFSETVMFYSGSTLVTHKAQATLPLLILNTFLYAGVGCLILAVVPAVCAYACTKYKFKFNKVIFMLNLVVMTLPIVGSYATSLTLLRNLGLYDNFYGNYIQKFSFTGMYFLVFGAFYETFPDAYLEAAEIDGASHYRVLFNIVIPLSAKMLGTVALIQFVSLWNDYQTPLMYLPTHPTLAYGVYYMAFKNTNGVLSKTPIKIASCMILAVPILILFIVFKDKLMGNISVGGIKE